MAKRGGRELWQSPSSACVPLLLHVGLYKEYSENEYQAQSNNLNLFLPHIPVSGKQAFNRILTTTKVNWATSGSQLLTTFIEYYNSNI